MGIMSSPAWTRKEGKILRVDLMLKVELLTIKVKLKLVRKEI